MKRLALVLLLLVPQVALGWGKSGHQIVARLAQDRLSDRADAEVRRLLGGQVRFLSAIAADPDQWRRNPGAQQTANWHFVNTELSAPEFQEGRDCPAEQCIVAQIENMRIILADKSFKDDVRREALVYLVHFVGDIHQPFHCGSGTLADGTPDRGGNLVQVRFEGRDDNLHHVWDSGLLERRRLSVADYVEHLVENLENADDLDDGDAADWANESHAIAIAQHVESGTRLSTSYVEENMERVDDRLLRAGLRLARVIEEALGPD